MSIEEKEQMNKFELFCMIFLILRLLKVKGGQVLYVTIINYKVSLLKKAIKKGGSYQCDP